MAFLLNEHGKTPTEVVLDAMAALTTDTPDVRRFAAAALTAVTDASTDAVEAADSFNELTSKTKQLLAQVFKQMEERTAETDDLQTRLQAERAQRRRAELARDQALADRTAEAAADDEAEVRRLRGELSAAWIDRDLHAGLLDAAEAERDAAIRARALLAARLADLDPDTEPEPEPADDGAGPGTFAEVFVQAAHPLLVFTLDVDTAAALDQHPQAPAWRRRAADTLATMAAYATAKATTRAAGHQPGPELADLAAFARHGGPEVVLSAGAVALGESRRTSTDPKFVQARTFDVPAQVNPTGQAPMFAHVRIGGVQPPAPRLHYYDDTTGTGHLIVGYLGPHLPSSRTN